MVFWNEQKAKENKRKHDVSFGIAVHIFNDPFLCEFYNVDHSKYEDRYSYIGSVMNELILFVIETDRENMIRVISARKATSKERKFYYENIKKLQSFNLPSLTSEQLKEIDRLKKKVISLLI